MDPWWHFNKFIKRIKEERQKDLNKGMFIRALFIVRKSSKPALQIEINWFTVLSGWDKILQSLYNVSKVYFTSLEKA